MWLLKAGGCLIQFKYIGIWTLGQLSSGCLIQVGCLIEVTTNTGLTVYCCDLEKNWLDFGDLGPIFKVTQGLRLFENGLSAPYLMKEWLDFDQICITILLWHEKELIRFWWPWPHSQGHRRAQIDREWLVCTLSPEWIDGFWPNLYSYIVETERRTD